MTRELSEQKPYTDVSALSGVPVWRSEWEPLLDAVVDRVMSTRAQVGDQWPYHADPDTGNWTTTSDGDWCPGHWIDSLRIVSEISEDAELMQEALMRMHQISPELDRNDMFRGTKFYHGAARLHAATGDEEMFKLAKKAAHAVRSMAMTLNGGMPIGTEVKVASTSLASNATVAVDNVCPNLLLDWWAAKTLDEPSFVSGARRHLDLTMRDFIRKDGSTIEFIDYDPASGEPIRHFTLLGAHDDSCWSRGQAWAINGYYRAWEELEDPKYLEVGRRLLDFHMLNSDNDLVPPWDYFDPDFDDYPMWDTSSSTIILTQLARIAVTPNLVAQAPEIVGIVEKMMSGLKHHVKQDGETRGALVNGCFNGVKRYGHRHELIWGNYYLLEALTTLKFGGQPC